MLLWGFISFGCSPLGKKIDPEASDNFYFNRFGTSVIYCPRGNWFSLGARTIEGADVSSFRVIGDDYAADTQGVYYEHELISDEEPKDFKHLAGPYAVGSVAAYFLGKRVHSSNPTAFRAFSFRSGPKVQYYGRDDQRVYCRDATISNDANHFHALKREGYFADSGEVYFMSDGVCSRFGADPSTFRFLKKQDGALSIYAADATHVFEVLTHGIVPGADPSTFHPLCSGVGPPHYAVDDRRVYEEALPIAGVTPTTFSPPPECK